MRKPVLDAKASLRLHPVEIVVDPGPLPQEQRGRNALQIQRLGQVVLEIVLDELDRAFRLAQP